MVRSEGRRDGTPGYGRRVRRPGAPGRKLDAARLTDGNQELGWRWTIPVTSCAVAAKRCLVVAHAFAWAAAKLVLVIVVVLTTSGGHLLFGEYRCADLVLVQRDQ